MINQPMATSPDQEPGPGADDHGGRPSADMVSQSVSPVVDRISRIFHSSGRAEGDNLAHRFRNAVDCLLQVHEGQWELEASCRAAGVSTGELGRLKRAIDESNARRVACVNDIDDSFGGDLRTGRRDAIPWPLTIGQMIDSMLIAGLKAHRIDPPRPSAAETFAHVRRSLEAMVTLAEDGLVTLPPASTIKDYGPANGATPADC